MDLNVLLLDDSVDGAIYAFQQGLMFGSNDDRTIQNDLTTTSSDEDLLKIKFRFRNDDLGDVCVNLWHNHREINTSEDILDLIPTLKDNKFDFILIDDHWGEGRDYLFGQNEILPRLFCDNDCHYGLFTAQTAQGDRIKKFCSLTKGPPFYNTAKVHLLAKDDKSRIYRVLSKICAEKQNKPDILKCVSPSSMYCSMVGKSEKMIDVFNQIDTVAQSSLSVLILGESGTGKDLVAKAIHKKSNRNDKPFVPMSGAAESEHLVESKLFGHVEGAFTGASTSREGNFRLANGGTLFLDEIGDLSDAMQSKLLRVIETQEVEPIGSDKVEKVDGLVKSRKRQNRY